MSEGLNRLFKAGGDAVLPALLASDGGGINVQDRHGLSPLAWAAGAAAEDTVERLLAAGADVNQVDHDHRTPLMQVLGHRSNHQGIARRLIEAGTDLSIQLHRNDDTALHMILLHAQDTGMDDLARLAVQHGAPVNVRNAFGNTPLHTVFSSLKMPVKTVPSAHPQVGALVVQPSTGVLAITEALLAAGADLHVRNQNDDTPFLCAVRGHHWAAADRLVIAGADLNVMVDKWGFAERMRMPPEERARPSMVPLQEKMLAQDPERWACWERWALHGWARTETTAQAEPLPSTRTRL